MAETPHQLQVLETERARLESQLADLAPWRELQRGEAVSPEQRSRLQSELSGNTVYQAWLKLGEVLALLKPPAEPSPELPAEFRELLRIKGLDEPTAFGLVAQGVTSLKQIAGWTAKDVKALKKQLGLKRRISQENWIEQAALLLQRPALAPVEGGPNSAPVAASAAQARPAARKPDSLTARLFARTPLPGDTSGQHRSLLAAIEAAEQSRIRAMTGPVLEAKTTERNTRSKAQTTDHHLAEPERALQTRSTSEPSRPPGEVGRAHDPEPTETAPPPARMAPERPLTPPPAIEPVAALAPVEEEADVEIVVKPVRGKAAPVRAPEPPGAKELFAIDTEAQGGEGYDPRAAAALRGAPQEASVEIVVHKDGGHGPGPRGR